MSDDKESLSLAAKILGGIGLGGLWLLLREWVRTRWAPKKDAIEIEEKRAEHLYDRISKLEDKLDRIHAENEERIMTYRKQIHDSNGRAARYHAHLLSLGYDVSESGNLVRIERFDK